MRTGAFEASARASAGTIASRNGSATAVPMPRRNVRLGSDLRVRIIGPYLSLSGDLFSSSRLKRNAQNNLLNQGLEPVTVRAQFPIHIIHCPAIVCLEPPSQRIGQHLLDQRARKLR